MGLLISKTDFVGKYKISQNTYTDIDSYISKYEEPYLIDLLGVELFDLFKAQVSSQVVAAGIYKDLYDPIREDDDSCIRISEGMKEMLLGFIFFEYMRDQKYKPTPSGKVTGQSELNRETSFEENNIYGRYNISIKSYETIQWYINENIDIYPTYNGQYKKIVSWF